MNTSPDDLRTEAGDALDRLLSDFFKAQLKQPWPAAPQLAGNEPSVLVAQREAAGDAHRNQPAARDTNRTSRLTLAASVALLLGTCWYLSNGLQPAAPGGGSPASSDRDMLKQSEAGRPGTLEEMRKNDALNGKNSQNPPIKLP